MKKATTKQKPSSRISNLATAFVALFLLGCLLVFLLPAVVESVFQGQLSKATGLPVELGKVHFSLTQPQFSVQDIQIMNPPDFPAGPLAEVSEARVRYAPSPKFVGGFELKRLEIDFRGFRVLRNEKGILNLPLGVSTSRGPVIKEVKLNLASATYTDLSGGQPSQQTFELGLTNAVYRNVKGISGLLEILNWEVLKRTGLEEKKAPTLPEVKPIAELPTANQTVPGAAPSAPAQANLSTSAPSPDPSAPKAG